MDKGIERNPGKVKVTESTWSHKNNGVGVRSGACISRRKKKPFSLGIASDYWTPATREYKILSP